MAAASSLAIAGLVTTVIAAAAGTGLSMVGANQQAEFQASINEQNARIAQQNAAQAEREALSAANATRTSNQRRIARLRAIQGSRGTVDTGSPLEVLADTATQLEREALDIEKQGKLQSNAYDAQAAIYQTRANYAKKSTGLTNLATALSGASNVATAGINYGNTLAQL